MSSLHLTLTEFDHMVNVGAFDVIQRRVELIRGELFEMNPAGPLHDYLITFLTDWSAEHRDRAKTIITSQTGLTLLAQTSRLEPDLMWLRKANYRAAHPTASDVQLAIEVSYSSLIEDLEIKRKLYAEGGIVEYWIVDAMASCIHVFTRPEVDQYTSHQVYKSPETLAPQIAPTAHLSLTDLFEN